MDLEERIAEIKRGRRKATRAAIEAFEENIRSAITRHIYISTALLVALVIILEILARH